METMTVVWIILGFISILALIYTFSVGISIIWNGCAMGFFVGLAIALKFYYYDGTGFDWLLLLKGAIIGSLAGTIFSFLKRK